MTKPNRIKAFMDSLPMNVESDGFEATVLSTDMSAIGAGENRGDCINDSKGCWGSKNSKNCKNYNDMCVDTSNGGSCVVTSMKRPGTTNGALCLP